MIQITKAHTVAFMKSRNYMVVPSRKKKKKTEDSENIFSKAFANRFWLTSKNYLWFNKVFMDDLLSNGLHEDVMLCY